MAVLTVTTINRAGVLDLVGGLVAASGGGDSFPNTGQQFMVFDNAGGGSITVTEVLQATVDGQSATPKTLVIPAGKIAVAGPWPTAQYNDNNSRMNFTYSAVTSLTVGVFQLTTS